VSGLRRPYIYNTTSANRMAQGHRRLHYSYMGEDPDHIPLERLLVDVRPGFAVKLGKPHRDLFPELFLIQPRSGRDQKGREEAIDAALLCLHDRKVILPRPRSHCEGLLWSSVDYMDHGPVLSRDTLKAAAE
jgi:hypothetical protein